jgi:hypothetical protein
VARLKQSGDTIMITAKSVGRDMINNDVADFISPARLS